MVPQETLSFSRTDSANFFRTLNKRVNDYFKDNKYVFVKFNKIVDGKSQLYNGSQKDGKTDSMNFYRDKAKRFQKAFEKSH